MYKIYIIIIVIFLLINYWAAGCALQSTWQSTPEFTQSSGTKIYLDIQGRFYTDCRIMLVQNEAVIRDGHITFIGLNPFSLLWFESRGIAVLSGFDGILPKKIYYKFNPMNGTLLLYKDVVYGDFVKL